MADTAAEITVVDDPAGQVFRASLADGTAVGGAYYEREGDVVTFTHTEVDPAFEGQGIGSQLAAGALGLVRDAGGRIVPLCPFIKKYVERHPEHADLLAHPAG
ncbi:N-acetyltransferase [Isoptericola sp. NEAU-Y5]|uniref:N-acetyltransferase n=1 Tax=Isoptericola luteus TaxID=2879484 RepID=A0ABS7ZA20_9MICO|nr:GNAT family N-acetyltransferase [Isoptericola sp. NEAU-Y5]MCA5891899.1 N-acetyltransferase [Isoptericola sp. NEAU-Y5]